MNDHHTVDIYSEINDAIDALNRCKDQNIIRDKGKEIGVRLKRLAEMIQDRSTFLSLSSLRKGLPSSLERGEFPSPTEVAFCK